ncbi:MAG: aldehyde dehydrogenase family protein, partial [Planctomycetales bacterium]|nr:aldehyde dehydrogenase family protein [Planctomycetales bacterium]
MSELDLKLSGRQLIAGQSQADGATRFVARDASTGDSLEPQFTEATAGEVDACLQAADQSVAALRAASPQQIADLLRRIAAGLEQAGDVLLQRAHQETGLPLARLTGERARTVGQARMFADLVEEGSWVQARIDHGDSERTPLPKPDVRTMLCGVGPVAVFGASNFPLAISVAGTDTVSALGARCPVVVKAHPGHPGTCELVG